MKVNILFCVSLLNFNKVSCKNNTQSKFFEDDLSDFVEIVSQKDKNWTESLSFMKLYFIPFDSLMTDYHLDKRYKNKNHEKCKCKFCNMRFNYYKESLINSTNFIDFSNVLFYIKSKITSKNTIGLQIFKDLEDVLKHPSFELNNFIFFPIKYIEYLLNNLKNINFIPENYSHNNFKNIDFSFLENFIIELIKVIPDLKVNKKDSLRKLEYNFKNDFKKIIFNINKFKNESVKDKKLEYMKCYILYIYKNFLNLLNILKFCSKKNNTVLEYKFNRSIEQLYLFLRNLTLYEGFEIKKSIETNNYIDEYYSYLIFLIDPFEIISVKNDIIKRMKKIIIYLQIIYNNNLNNDFLFYVCSKTFAFLNLLFQPEKTVFLKELKKIRFKRPGKNSNFKIPNLKRINGIYKIIDLKRKNITKLIKVTTNLSAILFSQKNLFFILKAIIPTVEKYKKLIITIFINDLYQELQNLEFLPSSNPTN